MPSNDGINSEEANVAGWEATQGAVIGALKWGSVAVILGAVGYLKSPVYRTTTIQFKVFLQSSAMVGGGIIEADRRLRAWEAEVRRRKRYLRDRAKWERYEEEMMKQFEK
ncbi:hypothetical protein B0I35DRAFT_432431 [Stachybotrys elegans]|uniref:HIG1 domain-containing protein n=1 Tax=Stachybotrys elegans TaxID=80388 RepID=A0A8K0WQX0_9HYPO|nr:hypothetical protein B0I35DRAFT_432431 [Stachybotrys elegans]